MYETVKKMQYMLFYIIHWWQRDGNYFNSFSWNTFHKSNHLKSLCYIFPVLDLGPLFSLRVAISIYSGSNNYLIPCWFYRFAHLQRMELCIILMIGTFLHWETEYHKTIQNNNIVQILYIYYYIFTWNKYLIHRTIGPNTWWRNLCWQVQRSDICFSFSAGLHRSWEGFWSTPLCKSSPNPKGSEAVAWQLEVSAPSTDFRWDLCLETG